MNTALKERFQGLGPLRRARMGRVEAFDEKRGLGSVRELSDAQREAVLFHCTAILDESRTIPPGTLVSYALIAGNRGEIQATDICRLEPDS